MACDGWCLYTTIISTGYLRMRWVLARQFRLHYFASTRCLSAPSKGTTYDSVIYSRVVVLQVIALICHLMEAKNDRGPFLIVVPSSVLPNWLAEISRWAPRVGALAYTGSPDERRRIFK